MRRLRNRGIFLALGVQVFLLMLGVGIVAPVLPLYAREFGVSVTAVGFLITVFGIARIGTDVPTGRLADRIGRRPLLIGGALAVAVGSFGFALAGTYAELVGWRFLQGVGSAATTTAAAIAVSELAAPEERGRALSLYQGTLLLGAGAGPVVGGFVAQGFGLRAPFYLLGGLALAAAAWATRLPETRPAPQPAASRERDARSPNVALPPPESVWRSREFWLVSLFTLAVFASRSGGQGTLLPLFGYDRLGLDESAIGLAFTVLMAFNVGAIYLSGTLSDHFGRKAAIVPGGLLTGAALALLPLSPGTAVFFALCALFGLAIGIAGPAPAAFIADIAPPEQLASTMGSYRMIADLGLMGGPVLFGWVAESFGYGSAFFANAAVIGLAALGIAVGARETRVTANLRQR